MNTNDVQALVAAINARQATLFSVDNDQLRNVACSHELIDVYAAVKELARRLTIGDVVVRASEKDYIYALDPAADYLDIDGEYAIYHHSWTVFGQTAEWQMVHYDEQIEAGIFMHYGYAVEMATGEGKTLVATLPVTLNALLGKNVHMMTSNSYLSRRDFEQMRPIYAFFGISTGCIETAPSGSAERKKAYNCDVVFGTTSEFAWDYLREHLATDKNALQQRAYDFAIIDELDSILIDDATNSYIISGSNYYSQEEQYRLWKAAVEELIKDSGLYQVDRVQATVELTDAGTVWISNRSEWEKAKELYAGTADLENPYWKNVIDQLLAAYILQRKDVDYIVYEGRVVIIDPSTGRRRDRSRWEYGLHTAVEIKEQVQVKKDSNSIAVISVKNFFRLYEKCAGMSGTIMQEARELYESYGLKATEISPHRQCIREDEAIRVFRNTAEKNAAICRYVKLMNEQGRPVLVGCRDIVKLREIVSVIEDAGLSPQVLDATDFGLEAYLIGQAGKSGSILVSTSMAGRGTDIKLDDAARQAGGLAVVATDLFFSERIDNQLRGRAGRQGDPGSSVIFTSVDDFIAECLSADDYAHLMSIACHATTDELSGAEPNQLLKKAQSNRDAFFAEKRAKNARTDDAIAPYRKDFYAYRQQILTDDSALNRIQDDVLDKEERIAFDMVLKSLYEKTSRLVNVGIQNRAMKNMFDLPLSCLPDTFVVKLDISQFSPEYFRQQYIRQITLQTFDEFWKRFVEHLVSKLEGDEAETLVDDFKQMLKDVNQTIRKRFLSSRIPINDRTQKIAHSRAEHKTIRRSTEHTKIVSDTLCPCGSGLTFARCHGQAQRRHRR